MPFKSDHALELLGRARDNGRLGHAYLITGPKAAQHEVFAARALDLLVGTRMGSLEGWEGQGAVVLRPQSKSRRITIGDDGDDPGTIRFLEKMIHQTAAPNGWTLAVIVDAERMNVPAHSTTAAARYTVPSATRTPVMRCPRPAGSASKSSTVSCRRAKPGWSWQQCLIHC